MFKWLAKLFKKNKPQEEEINWDDMSELRLDKRYMNLADPEQMERYVRNCCEQIKEATEEIDRSTLEFAGVTERLTDMEELDLLPLENRQVIRDAAQSLMDLSQEWNRTKARTPSMPEERFRMLERKEDEIPDAVEELRSNEEYKAIVRQDLQNLEGEKVSYRFRRAELRHTENSARKMVAVVLGFVVILLLTLAFLQVSYEMDVKLGYLLCASFCAVSLTVLYIRFNDAKNERMTIEKKLNQAISVQNTVKIRYVNTSSLIEYTCTKYNVNSSNELAYLWDCYLVEKKERQAQRETDERLADAKDKLLALLRQNRVKNTDIWLHQPQALVDPREMVEIRHEMVAMRGSLRKRIAYNEENRSNIKNDVLDVVREYPDMSGFIMEIVDEYDC